MKEMIGDNSVRQSLQKLGYRFVTVDLEGYRQGGVSLTPPA